MRHVTVGDLEIELGHAVQKPFDCNVQLCTHYEALVVLRAVETECETVGQISHPMLVPRLLSGIHPQFRADRHVQVVLALMITM